MWDRWPAPATSCAPRDVPGRKNSQGTSGELRTQSCIRLLSLTRLGSHQALLSPTNRLALILLIQPLLKRREVVQNRGGIQIALPGEFKHGVLPGAAEAHLQHAVQAAAGFLVVVDRATIERSAAARRRTSRRRSQGA